MIGDVFTEGNVGALGAARSVYLALSEIASDKQSETFTVATSYIAQRAGVTSKTVRRMIAIFKKLGFVKTQPRSANGMKLATEYTLIRGDDSTIGLIYPTMGQARKTHLPIREESHEQSREGTARKEKVSVLKNGSGPTPPTNLNGDDGDIVIHERTGERFNKRTKEYVW
jgi:hypothetical protein